MKHLASFILLIVASYAAHAQCRFENAYPYYLSNYPTKTIASSDGGFVTVAGAYYDTIHPGWNNGQDQDMVIIKTDSCGKTLWQMRHGDAHADDDAMDVVETDAGNYLVTGAASDQLALSNIRVACFSRDGVLKWSKLYSGSSINTTSTGIIKSRNKQNSYLAYGSTLEQTGPVSGNGYIVELNDTGKFIRNREFYKSEGFSILKVFEMPDTSYLLLGIGKDSLYLMNIDTSLNIRWSRTLFTDTFGKMDRFYAAGLSYDGQSIALAMEAPLSNKPGSFSEDLLVRINLQGDLIMYKIIEDVTLYPKVTFITATPNNGYLMGGYLRYTDSSFNQLKYQKVYGAGFSSAIINTDGSVTLSGDTYKHDTTWGNVCVVRVDSLGSTAVHEVREAPDAAFHVYPNPATDVLHIHAETNELIHIALLNALGQRVYEGSFSGSTTIAISTYPQGVYFLRFNAENGTFHTARVAVTK